MKIAIVSDMHLGYERFKADAYEQAKSSMELASSMADAIIIPGDVFDNRSPKPEVLAQAINIFREASKREWKARVSNYHGDRSTFTDVPIVAISGTHERTAVGRDNALRLLDLAGLLVDTSEATTVISNGADRVAIYGLGGISEEIVTDKIKELDPRPVPGSFNIFMLHQSIYELLPFSDQFMKLNDLPIGFDLYVDGHIHNMIEESVHGKKLLIPGSTVLTQLKDSETESKGFILFDTSDSTYKFIKIKSRRFVSKNIEVEDAGREDIRKLCEEVIESSITGSDYPIIRIRLSGTIKNGVTNGSLGLKGIISKYSGKAIVDIDSSRVSNPELQTNIESVRNNEVGGMSIRERGLEILNSQLKQMNVGPEIRTTELLDILVNGSSKKNEFIEDALRVLDSG